MKKNITLLFILALLGCEKKSNALPVNNITFRKSDQIIKNLEMKYSNYENNELVRTEMAAALDKKVDSIFMNNVISDIPVEIFKIRKNPHGEGALVQLYTNNEFDDEKLRSNFLNFDIIGFMSEKEASKINEGEKYLVSGKPLKRLSKVETMAIVPMIYHGFKTEIDKGAITDKYSYNIGNVLMKIDSLKLIKK